MQFLTFVSSIDQLRAKCSYCSVRWQEWLKASFLSVDALQSLCPPACLSDAWHAWKSDSADEHRGPCQSTSLWQINKYCRIHRVRSSHCPVHYSFVIPEGCKAEFTWWLLHPKIVNPRNTVIYLRNNRAVLWLGIEPATESLMSNVLNSDYTIEPANYARPPCSWTCSIASHLDGLIDRRQWLLVKSSFVVKFRLPIFPWFVIIVNHVLSSTQFI